VGLDYLTLDRLASTLSGGEAQRIQLATCLGSRLVARVTCSTSLPSACTARHGRLIRILEELRELGNTIVVVEHDADVMRAADHIVDLGPGAGERGGESSSKDLSKSWWPPANGSLTARYLRGELARLPCPAQRAPRAAPSIPMRVLRISGARAHNLKTSEVESPGQ